MWLKFIIAPLALLLVLTSCASASKNPAEDAKVTMTETDPIEESETGFISEPEENSVGQQIRYTYEGDQLAPDFPAGLEWLNVERPISIHQDLRGKIVLLDFWTLGCINCIHIIPDLKRLETEYPESLVVIGVHSAKFASEGQLESIRKAVLRYGLEHPVVNDHNFQVWRSFGARAWPTLVLIDPFGKAVGYHAGEGVYQLFKPIIDVMDREFRSSGVIDTRPIDLVLESKSLPPSILSFPGKVLADEDGGRLFIADSNHNRILVSTLEGELLYAIGSGEQGLEDGDFATATFSRPQGMTLSQDGNTLYIADLENHTVRAADLLNQQVITIVGTGKQARVYPSGGAGLSTALSSPWDLLIDGESIYLAMAGVHQLWAYDLAEDRVSVFAGSGREGLDDGPANEATLAQPSGLTSDGEYLYFTDPEASAIRKIRLDGTGNLETIVGTGLFDFGDVDGKYPTAQLQHALGITYDGGKLYVADTYNHKIKIIDPVEQTSSSWSGNGASGWVGGSGDAVQYSEPSGLSIAGNKLYIADTNNHLIRVADLTTGEVSTLVFSNLEVAVTEAIGGLDTQLIAFGPQTVGPGEGELEFFFNVPEGYKFNDLGPFTLSWQSDNGSVIKYTGGGEPGYKQVGPEFPIRFPISLQPGETTIYAQATAFYCQTGDEAFCLVQDVDLEIPIIVSEGSIGTSIVATHLLPKIEE